MKPKTKSYKNSNKKQSQSGMLSVSEDLTLDEIRETQHRTNIVYKID